MNETNLTKRNARRRKPTDHTSNKMQKQAKS